MKSQIDSHSNQEKKNLEVPKISKPLVSSALSFGLPFSLTGWIEANREKLKPPVCNQQVWEDADFIVMVIGGPNDRTDYHVNQGEEFFYQIEGTLNLKVLDQGKSKDIFIQPGDIFLLPPQVPHSPRRPAGSVGIVIERKRQEHEVDGFLWLCPHCDSISYEETLLVKNIVTNLPPVFERAKQAMAQQPCKKCGKYASKN